MDWKITKDNNADKYSIKLGLFKYRDGYSIEQFYIDSKEKCHKVKTNKCKLIDNRSPSSYPLYWCEICYPEGLIA